MLRPDPDVIIEESLASHPRFEPVKIALPPLLLNNMLGSSTVVGYFKPRWQPKYEFATHRVLAGNFSGMRNRSLLVFLKEYYGVCRNRALEVVVDKNSWAVSR